MSFRNRGLGVARPSRPVAVRSSNGFDLGKPQVDSLSEFDIVEADA